MSEIEPLPCPLCGGLAKIYSTETFTKIRCIDGNCGVEIARFMFAGPHRKSAILAWNRRVSPLSGDGWQERDEVAHD